MSLKKILCKFFGKLTTVGHFVFAPLRATAFMQCASRCGLVWHRMSSCTIHYCSTN